MNFFDRQHAARGTSLRLVLLFTLAVLSIVAATGVVAAFLARSGGPSTIISAVTASTIITLLIIGGGTASKMVALRAGGAAVAQSVGAVSVDPSTTDPRLRRFANVVEEMSIASGVPMPRLFVLEQESSINAFAAGYSPADAAITATAGSLDTLSRDELQGVIGHEFSHILNGDMRLNVRLIGLLNGILLLGLVGLRLLQFGGGNSNRKGGNPILVLAIAALVFGFIGQFFAGLIKAGVSRQREWLADASSVQFTRQTSGLAGALKKIAGLPEGSVIKDAHAEKQINHMLFGEGARGISQLYATHPPLLDRIRALEPGFDPRSLSDASGTRPDGMAEDVSLGFATNAPPPRAVAPAVTPAALSAKVGTFTPADLLQGAALSAQIPGDIRQAASQASTAVPLLLALLLDRDAAVRANQLGAVTASLGATVTAAVEQLAIRTAQLPEMLRLPVVGIAAPLLTARPSAELATIVATIDTLVAADGAISVFEYCLTHLVRAYIADSGDPQRRSRAGRGTVAGAQGAAVTLLAVIAAAGNADPVAAQHAYEAAIAHLMPAMAAPPYAVPADLARALDGGWAALDALDPRHKQPLIEAVVVAICDDGVLQDAEAQLLRVTCALLHCPLPALLS